MLVISLWLWGFVVDPALLTSKLDFLAKGKQLKMSWELIGAAGGC